MNMTDNQIRWAGKHDVYRPTTEFSDLLKIVACYYDMYSKAVNFLGPWIAKQSGKTMFLVPSKDEISAALGKERAAIDYRSRLSFIDNLINFISKTRGKKTLITPSPSSHHSAQFPASTFKITQVMEPVKLRDDKGIRKEPRTLHKIEFANADVPVYIENLSIPANQIEFVIIRPKLGQLGTAAVNRWEVLLYKVPYGYLIEHVDSHLNPRYSGIM